MVLFFASTVAGYSEETTLVAPPSNKFSMIDSTSRDYEALIFLVSSRLSSAEPEFAI